MIEKVLLRWKAVFCVYLVAWVIMIVLFVSTGEITVSVFKQEKQQMMKKSNSNNKSTNVRKPSCPAFDRLSSSAKNTTRKNCSVSIFTSTNATEYYSLNSPCPVCTSALFKIYYRTHSAFIADGYWDILTSGDKITTATFRPPFCSITLRDLDPNFIRKCFLERKIRKIIILGDSIGKMTFTGVTAVLASTETKQCKVMKAEEDDFSWNIRYYLPHRTFIPKQYVNIVTRPCYSCDARQLRCFCGSKNISGISRNTSLVLEFLPMSYIIDSSIRILKPFAGFRPTIYTQEFLFRDYLRLTGQPDVVIIVAPFLQEVLAGLERYGKFGQNRTITYLVTILNKYLPKSRPYAGVLSTSA